MKKIAWLFFFPLFLVACTENIEKYREAIMNASTERDVLTDNLRTLLQQLTGELERWSFYQAELGQTASTAEAPAQNQTELTQLRTEFNGFNTKIVALVQEISGLAKSFPKQQKELETLTNALSGSVKYEGDVKETLEAVNDANAAVRAKVSDWEKSIKELGQAIEAQYAKIKSLQSNSAQ